MTSRFSPSAPPRPAFYVPADGKKEKERKVQKEAEEEEEEERQTERERKKWYREFAISKKIALKFDRTIRTPFRSIFVSSFAQQAAEHLLPRRFLIIETADSHKYRACVDSANK